MPLYEYECKQCKRHTEKIQKFSDAEITTCPHCGGPLERVITAPAIAFKGGGWYADGYGNAKPAASSSSSEGGVDKGGSSEASGGAGSSGAKESSASTSDASAAAASPSSAPAPAPSSAAPASSSSEKK